MGKRLWVERNKDGSWDAFSDDGAHIKFGKDRGQFTPGDLMKVALANGIGILALGTWLGGKLMDARMLSIVATLDSFASLQK